MVSYEEAGSAMTHNLTLVMGGPDPDVNVTNCHHHHTSPDRHLGLTFESFVYTWLMSPVCAFGLLGNLLNLGVLTYLSRGSRMERMEKSVHSGLTALALSDTCFCVMVLPRVMLTEEHLKEYVSLTFELMYTMYSSCLINTFILTSTWLTVAMAMSRYFAICHPMHARSVIGVRSARATIVIIFILACLMNLPRYWNKSLYRRANCDGGTLYASIPGIMLTTSYQTVRYMYTWIYFILGILLPVLTLAVCNVYLIKALNRSALMRSEHTRERDRTADSKAILTRILIVIVLLYIVLVIPGELLIFFREVVRIKNHSSIKSLNIVIAAANFLQTINFSVNFVLYCVINVKFRRVVKQLFLCGTCRGHKQSTHHQLAQYQSMTVMTATQVKLVGEDNDIQANL